MSTSDLDLIRGRRAEIAQMRDVLDAEEAELAIAERTLVRLMAAKRNAQAHVHKAKEPELPNLPSGNGHMGEARAAKPVVAAKPVISIRGYIIDALKATPSPWLEDAATLRALIKSRCGQDININSYYPTLTEMKSKGTIVRDGSKIALAERVAKVN